MSKSILYAVIGVLAALVLVLALGLERAKPSGLSIDTGKSGLSPEHNGGG